MMRSIQRFLIAISVLASGSAAVTPAAEIGYIEDFALARDRTKALAQLIPGTEDYYYFHCLHYQNNAQFDEVEQLLETWIKRHNYTERVQEIQNRQALLTYSQHPEESLEFLRKRLGIEFNHQRERLGEKPNLPTELDPQSISRETLTKRAFADYKNLEGFEDAGLEWLIATELDPPRRHHLLERLSRPDYPQLVELIVDDLDHELSRGFGSLVIHRQLLLSQLDECLRLKPDLLNQTNFVNTYLTRLHPHADMDWRHDVNAHRDYLQRLWDYVSRLAPAHNSLKAHVLYHRLEFDRSLGVYDRQRFITYLRLPRNVGYIRREFVDRPEHRRHVANLGEDFRSVTQLRPVVNDEPLVRSYLHHFFVDADSYAAYEPYIQDQYLKHHFAETKIVNGLGDPEKWYSLLPPGPYQQLKERIDLDFAYTNNKSFAPDDSVRLDLYVKNVNTLIVKVYEINTKNYYRENGREVDTDVNLDGLIANHEETFTFSEPPLRRVRRTFEFPQLEKPGVYVIDFIGNGRSSRAVVRKGKLRHLVSTTTAGQRFTVWDDANHQVQDATLWLGGHEYTAGDEGAILVPFTNNPGRQPIVLSRGDFSSLAHFQHEAENYELRAGVYVDRESLLERKKATVILRPQLYLNGVPVTLSDLEETKLTITSEDLDGVSTTKEIEDFELLEDREATYEFQVPQRLTKISFTLAAKIQNLSQNKKIDLTASDSFSLNEIDRGDKTEDLHLTKIEGRYYVDLLGKTGEALADRAVHLELKHHDFRGPVHQSLETDAKGRVALGTLRNIQWLKASSPQGVTHTWSLDGDRHTYSQSVHAAADEVIRLPYMGQSPRPLRSELSLLELRGGAFAADRFETLSIEDGMLLIRDLPRGDYDLLLKRAGSRIRLRITEGDKNAGYALGNRRSLELRNEDPLQIASVSSDQENLVVQLAGVSPFARVHVFATRFQPAYSAFSQLGVVGDIEPVVVRRSQLESLYVEGRNIGDEYRYIIDRKYAAKFPGNMAARPNLLINPWVVRKTSASEQQIAAGDEFAATDAEPSEKAERALAEAAERQVPSDFSSLDFLAQASAVLLNLHPDKEHRIEIPRDQLVGHQCVHVVAVDPQTTAYRSLSLAETPREVNDLRLADGLDPAAHFTQQKQVSVVRKNQTFELADITSSRFQAYDTLADIYGLFATLSGDAKLLQFGFILDWPNLSREERHAKYSEYACHELNFFLFKKDPEFFREVVQPFIANKKDKTFLDRWLLDQDLSPFINAWDFEQLNTVERILLSMKIADQRPHVIRHVREMYDLVPPDIDRFNLLFNTAVQGSALDTEDELGMAAGLSLLRSQTQSLQEWAAATNGAIAAPPVPSAPRPAMAAEAAPPGARGLGLDDVADDAAEMPAAAAKRKLDRFETLDKPERRAGRATARARGRYFYDAREQLGEELRQFYQKLDQTAEWAENNYYLLPIQQQVASLVTANAFWHEYVQHDRESPFYSVHVADASRNFTEMMFALAVIDLPFETQEHESKFDEAKMTLTAGSPLVVYHEEIKPASEVAEETPILVSQNFFRRDDRYRFVGNERLDKFVSEEFLPAVVYGCQIAVTNPTSSPQMLDVLVQIPVGAMPVLGGKNTRSVKVQLDPFNTKTVEYFFYFPSVGDFSHYPVHVAKNEKLLAFTEPFVFHVVAALSKIDTKSWSYISQSGSPEQVLAYLQENNLQRTDLEKIAWRMHDKRFFAQVIQLLDTAHAYNHTLWSYGIRHDDVRVAREYLQHANDFVARCGDYLESPLLTIDPVARRSYEHLEYAPLVNVRAHRLGRRREILNERIHHQYHQLLKILSYRQEFDDQDLMAITYYLLLQDRVAEGMEFFGHVNPRNLQTELQYDYFQAYLDLYQTSPELARKLTDEYADYPVDRWRNAFANIANQLKELDGLEEGLADTEDRAQVQARAAATEPNFDFDVEDRKISINYQNLSTVRVNYYLMDVELLFSTNPFVQQFGGQFSYIRPNAEEVVDLPAAGTKHQFDLPASLHNSNVLVEISSGAQTKTQPYFANSLNLQVIENYGQLQVLDESDRQPVPMAYVKVYARLDNGEVQFYKDGYTDLRGRFDYSSLNTNELDRVQKFSILVLSEEYGAVIQEANPPKR